MKAMLCAVLAAAAAVFCACRVLSASETAPATPKNLKIITGPEGSHTLAWDAVPGAKGYKIFRSCTWEAWPDLNDKETSSTSIACSCEGYFTVSAFNGGGESAKAEPPVLYGPPPAPANVRIEKSGSAHYLRWNAVLGAVSYTIYWSVTNLPVPFPPASSFQAGVTETECLIVTPGYYWVAAVAWGKESEISERDNAHL